MKTVNRLRTMLEGTERLRTGAFSLTGVYARADDWAGVDRMEKVIRDLDNAKKLLDEQVADEGAERECSVEHDGGDLVFVGPGMEEDDEEFVADDWEFSHTAGWRELEREERAGMEEDAEHVDLVYRSPGMSPGDRQCGL